MKWAGSRDHVTAAMVLLATGACASIAGIKGPDEAAPVPEAGATGALARVEITAESLDFGDVPCGSPPAPKLIALVDKGTDPATFEVQVPEGAPFHADPAQGTLQPNQPATTVSITASPTRAAEFKTDLLVSAGATMQTVAVRARGTGATYDVLTPTVDFGEVRNQDGGSAVAIIRNSGTEDLVVTDFASDSPEFEIDWSVTPKPLTVEPGKTANVTLKLVAGAETPLGSTLGAKLTPTIPAATGLCGDAAPIQLSGRRVNLDVIITPADFGPQPCNTQPAPKDIVITSYVAAPLTYTTAAPADFAVVSGGSGSIPAASSAAPQQARISVQPNPLGIVLGPRPTEEFTVTITGVTAPSGGARPVPATVDVRGAIVSVMPTNVTGFKSDGSYWDGKAVKITNSGVDPLGVYWRFTRPQGPAAWSYAFPNTIPVGNSKGVMYFKPTDWCPCEAKLEMVVTSGTLCGDPISIDFQGTN